MGLTQRKRNELEDVFSLTVDEYGRLWLHTKLEGIPVAIDLAEKEVAFEIMAAKMAEHAFDYHPVQQHGASDNDDEERI